jgi:hypothetical protein
VRAIWRDKKTFPFPRQCLHYVKSPSPTTQGTSNHHRLCLLLVSQYEYRACGGKSTGRPPPTAAAIDAYSSELVDELLLAHRRAGRVSDLLLHTDDNVEGPTTESAKGTAEQRWCSPAGLMEKEVQYGQTPWASARGRCLALHLLIEVSYFYALSLLIGKMPNRMSHLVEEICNTQCSPYVPFLL